MKGFNYKGEEILEWTVKEGYVFFVIKLEVQPSDYGLGRALPFQEPAVLHYAVSNARNVVMGFLSGAWVMQNGLKRHRYACLLSNFVYHLLFESPKTKML